MPGPARARETRMALVRYVRNMRFAAFAGLILGLFPIAVSAAPVTPEDLFKLTLLSNAAISPDGAHVLVEASRMNGPKNTYDRTIELVDVSTGGLTHNVTKRVGRRRLRMDAG